MLIDAIVIDSQKMTRLVNDRLESGYYKFHDGAAVRDLDCLVDVIQSLLITVIPFYESKLSKSEKEIIK